MAGITLTVPDALKGALEAHRAGDRATAERLCRAIIGVRSDHYVALNLLGVIECQKGRHAIGLTLFDHAIAAKPEFVEALTNRGEALRTLNRPADALETLDRALAFKSDSPEIFNNRGVALADLQSHQEALESYDRALAIKPDYADALSNRGTALSALNRHQEALESYDQALIRKPNSAEALTNRGNTLSALDRKQDALESHDRALRANPHLVEALFNRGTALRDLRRDAEALECYEKVWVLDPAHPHVLSRMAHSARAICDWNRTAVLAPKLTEAIIYGISVISPFVLIGYGVSPSMQMQCAQLFVREGLGVTPKPASSPPVWRHEKIRVAYFSPDFRNHAVSFLIAELIELHDRSRFEVFGISFGRDDGSKMRARLAAAFDHFLDVRSKSDTEVAELMRALEIDIAIDLTGYTKGCRPGIFARRASPIQVSYLGFPATMGADFIDYIIADRIVLPIDQQPFYSERIVHLPDSFQVNDSRRGIAEHTPSRSDLKLPEEGFVLCCLNNSYKITPDIFDIWMRLLKQIDGSVLWLLGDNAGLRKNLAHEAERRGVSASRLIFGPHLPLDEHLARYRMADLFLDTSPCSAGTTASDALWAGLPLLTCYGESFAGRAASSILHAVGLPELIAKNLAEYEVMALRLVRDPALLGSLRNTLKQNAPKSPLFNADRFRRHIETAYSEMWQRRQQGESPQSFAVQPER